MKWLTKSKELKGQNAYLDQNGERSTRSYLSHVNRLRSPSGFCRSRRVATEPSQNGSTTRLEPYKLMILSNSVTSTILTPFLATIAAFGILAWIGFPIYSMQCVTPFLVLGIGILFSSLYQFFLPGVDDAFILMHRWRARSSIQDRATRLRRVVVDVGPSITITSITNIIAFGVGFFTPTPQVTLTSFPLITFRCLSSVWPPRSLFCSTIYSLTVS